MLLVAGVFVVVADTAWAEELPTACYEPGGETVARNEANHQEGYRRVILGVVPGGTQWVPGETITLTSAQCEAASDLYTLLGLEKGTDELFWEDVIEAILVPPDKAKRGFTGEAKLEELESGKFQLVGTLSLKNEAAVKAAIGGKGNSRCALPTGEAASSAPTLGGGVTGLIQRMAFGPFIPKEAFETGALSLEVGAHFGGHVGTGDDKKDAVGWVAAIRAPVWGDAVASDDRLERLESGVPLDVKCEVTPYRVAGQKGVLLKVELVSSPWERPQRVTDKRVGLMAGYGSEPDVFMIGPSVAINRYFRAYGASTFGESRDGQWVFGVTLNTGDRAGKLLEDAAETVQGKEPAKEDGDKKDGDEKDEDGGKEGEGKDETAGAGSGPMLYGLAQDPSRATVTPAKGAPAGHTISGFVWTLQTDGTMAGIEGAHVQLMEVAEDAKTATTAAFVVSGPGGGFAITGLDPGRSYRLTASALGFPVGESSTFTPADLKELPGVRLTRPVQ